MRKKSLEEIQEKLEQKNQRNKKQKMIVTGKGTFMLKNLLNKKAGK
jgi:uncharacterized hydantoinase/oxoprolinase family protein